jgi:hypothetical protein
MSDYDGVFDGLFGLAKIGIAMLCVAIPLAIWKAVEIVIWCWHHVSIGIT